MRYLHQAPSEVVSGPQQPSAMNGKTRTWPQLFLKCEYVDPVKQLCWKPHTRTLLHCKCDVQTVVGLAPTPKLAGRWRPFAIFKSFDDL